MDPSNKISGCVNFPVNDSIWNNTNEGGMIVKLVVCDNRDFEDRFSVCSGGVVNDRLTGCFINDDKCSRPAYSDSNVIQDHDEKLLAWKRRHFPNYGESSIAMLEEYLSRNYLAVIVLGTTGWSGWNEVTQEMWYCTVDDLNNHGKLLYSNVQALYPGCALHLLTFLDT